MENGFFYWICWPLVCLCLDLSKTVVVLWQWSYHSTYEFSCAVRFNWNFCVVYMLRLMLMLSHDFITVWQHFVGYFTTLNEFWKRFLCIVSLMQLCLCAICFGTVATTGFLPRTLPIISTIHSTQLLVKFRVTSHLEFG